MKHFFAAFLTSTTLLAVPAFAADVNAPPFENGPVWRFQQVQTKDGHFDDYMRWLSTDWKAQEEALKKRGIIVDYKVYIVTDPRQNEPDVLLATEYANMAAFDTPVAKSYATRAEISGSVVKANEEQAARAAIRTAMDNILVREAILK